MLNTTKFLKLPRFKISRPKIERISFVASVAFILQCGLSAGPITHIDYQLISLGNLGNNVSQSKMEQMVDDLLRRGANINAAKYGVDFWGVFSLESALHSATSNRNYNLVEVLLSRGANPNNPIETSHHGPLTIAVKHNDYEMAVILLDNGANVDGNYTYSSGRKYTPLHFAVERDYYDLAQLLLEKGANPNQRNPESPLLKGPVAMAKTKKMRDLLISHGGEKTYCQKITSIFFK